MAERPRVFGIGASRTGTRSVFSAMFRLGWRSSHCPESFEEIDRAEFSNDVTVAAYFKELDKKYPGSKFILTLRDPEAWSKSIIEFFEHLRTQYGPPTNEIARHFANFIFDAEKIVYRGVCQWSRPYDQGRFRRGFALHNAEVIEYFKNRDDLLVMNVFEGDGWEKLCDFLGQPVPRFPFPHGGKSGW